MKKIIIGTLVATVIFFIYQSLAWMSGFHSDFSSYTPNQDSIISNLDKNIPADGLYTIPWADPASPDRSKIEEEMWTKNIGKPWAMIFFHKSMDNMEATSMIVGFMYTLIACLMVVLVLYHGNFSTFGTRFMVSMGFAIFALCQCTMGEMNWWSFPWSFIKSNVIDLTLGWALCSLWMAKYVRKI